MFSPKNRSPCLHLLRRISEFYAHPYSLAVTFPQRSVHLTSQLQNDQPARKSRPSTPSITDFRMRIMAAANVGHSAECYQIAHSMKAARVSPDLSIYDALLNAAANDGGYIMAWAIFDDMVRLGIHPTATTFAHLIHAQRHRSSEYLWRAIDKMSEFNIQPNIPIYSSIITGFVEVRNLETALQFYFAMQAQKLTPELGAVQQLIAFIAECQLPRLAIDIATTFENGSQRRLEGSTWLACLSSSAQSLYMDGVAFSWPLVVDYFNLVPDEGLCLSVLHTAARHGAPDLATDVLRILKVTGVQWEEHHFAAVIEAFCRNKQLKEALMTLQIMRANEILPVQGTTAAILERSLVDIEAIDNAWALIDEIHKEGKDVGIDILKLIIRASVALGDLQRSVGVYKAFSDYGQKADVETFNILLDGCIAAQHRHLGDMFLSDMKELDLKPDEETFSKTIYLCLTQEIYEDAFFYLEEMKTAGFLPPRKVYVALVQKCWAVNDARASIVLEEMKECGYALPPRPGRGPSQQATPEPSSSPLSHQPLDRAAMEFINTGGT